MRKKLLSLAAIAAALLVSLTNTTQVFATSRTTTLEIVGIVFGENAADGQQVLGARREGTVGKDLIISSVIVQDAVNKLNNIENIAALISDAKGSAIEAANVTVLDSMEVKTAPGIVVSAENPVSITFSFPGVTANSNVYVLHYENGNWVVVPTTVGDGVVTGTFTSLSPVALVADKTTLKSAVLGANRAVSPRTGEENRFPVAIIAGCVAVLLILAIADRKIKSK